MITASLGGVARTTAFHNHTEALRVIADALSLKERALEHNIVERDRVGVDMDREISDNHRRNLTFQLLSYRARIAQLELEMFELRCERLNLRAGMRQLDLSHDNDASRQRDAIVEDDIG